MVATPSRRYEQGGEKPVRQGGCRHHPAKEGPLEDTVSMNLFLAVVTG